MLGTADDIALALVRIADRRGEPTVEHLAPLLSGLSRRERAVLAGFFERLAEEERAAPVASSAPGPAGEAIRDEAAVS
jgi:hypothetical protein